MNPFFFSRQSVCMTLPRPDIVIPVILEAKEFGGSTNSMAFASFERDFLPMLSRYSGSDLSFSNRKQQLGVYSLTS